MDLSAAALSLTVAFDVEGCCPPPCVNMCSKQVLFSFTCLLVNKVNVQSECEQRWDSGFAGEYNGVAVVVVVQAGFTDVSRYKFWVSGRDVNMFG